MRGFGVPALAALVAALSLLWVAGADAATLNARGSVEQVQVTGADPGSKVKLLDKAGKAVQSKTAGSLGGVIFRKVAPGGGYSVKSGGSKSPRLRVMTKRSAPPDPSIYNQTLPPGGYGYLTTRDGTQLADQRPPSGPRLRRPVPDRGRVLRLRLRQPRRRRELDRADRVPARLRDRRHQHARHRLLGRRLRLLRDARRASTATTRSRPSPASPGPSTTRSGCSVSPTAGSASCSSRRRGRRASPGSRRCR